MNWYCLVPANNVKRDNHVRRFLEKSNYKDVDDVAKKCLLSIGASKLEVQRRLVNIYSNHDVKKIQMELIGLIPSTA